MKKAKTPRMLCVDSCRGAFIAAQKACDKKGKQYKDCMFAADKDLLACKAACPEEKKP